MGDLLQGGRVLLRDADDSAWRFNSGPGLVQRKHDLEALPDGEVSIRVAHEDTPRRSGPRTRQPSTNCNHGATRSTPRQHQPPLLDRNHLLIEHIPSRPQPNRPTTDSSLVLLPDPSQAMIARETLADLLALACERDRTMVSMRVEGHSTTEIAARLGCSGRSVRRYFADLYGRGGPCALSVRRLRDVYRLEPCDNTSSATALASVSRPRSTAVRSFVARGSDSSTSRIFINPIRRFEAADRTPIRASPR